MGCSVFLSSLFGSLLSSMVDGRGCRSYQGQRSKIFLCDRSKKHQHKTRSSSPSVSQMNTMEQSNSNKRRNQSRSFCDILMLYELFALFRPFTVRTAIFGQQLDYPCPVFCFSVQAIGSDDGGRPLPPKGPEAACTFGEGLDDCPR